MSAPDGKPWAISVSQVCAARSFRRIASILLLGMPLSVGAGPSGGAPRPGEAIYRGGVVSSGAPLEAQREGGLRMQGAEAACINCHRRSGLGTREGRIAIPPIVGRYLFPSDTRAAGNQYVPYVETMHLDHEPAYTDATLARAIREGVDAWGRPFDYLMPRYTLGDEDMAALIAYLKELDRHKTRGVTDRELHFATIITPDADPVKRRAMLDVIERYFADRNNVQYGPTQRLHSSRKMSWVSGMLMVNRRWQLHVWELTGPAGTWEAQLTRHLAEEPVLAVVSGLGGANWAPVHAFCEHEALPCLFPNVEAPPPDADHDFYSLYFSRGVELEAGLIASRIVESGAREVLEVYRAGDSGEPAAEALENALRGHGIKVLRHVLARGNAGKDIARALGKASRADALVLWLRPADIKALGAAPPGHTAVYLSGLMGGLDRVPLQSSWLTRTHVAYPFDLPERRRVPVDYALGWFAIRHIPIVEEQVQADTFLACGLLAETLGNMADNFVSEYLVERVQDMIEHRLITGYYPRLALAPGQRFASKGGYVVHFDDHPGRHPVADSDWLVP